MTSTDQQSVRVHADTADSQHDITEGVRVLYDTVVASMDWGSGFLDAEEVASILTVAAACSFETPDELMRMHSDYLNGLWGNDAPSTTKIVCGICQARIYWDRSHETGHPAHGWEHVEPGTYHHRAHPSPLLKLSSAETVASYPAK